MAAENGTCVYRVQTKTGTLGYSSTDSRIFIKIIGKEGATNFIQLDNPGINDFESGRLDVFTITSVDVGEVTTIELKSDTSGNEPGWYVEYVNVIKGKTIETFTYNTWITTKDIHYPVS